MKKSGTRNCARRSGLIALTIATMIAAGCGGGGGGGGGTAANSTVAPQSGASPDTGSTPTPVPEPTSGVNTPPTISATLIGEINVGSDYALTPLASDADTDTLAFSIENRPAWATFNTATGQLSGRPGAQDVGAHGNVMISVSDGNASASLPAFSIMVTLAASTGDPVAVAVALSWDVPTVAVDGSTLNDLSGYRIHYGKSADVLTETIEIPNPALNQYVVEGLEAGTHYFAVRAVTGTGAQSAPSNIISRIIS